MRAWKVPLTDGGFEKQQNLEMSMSLDGSWHQGWVWEEVPSSQDQNEEGQL
jgi:hypothetical protein